MKRLLPLLALMLFFTSCIGTSIHTTFNRDGSGTLVMEFTISQMFFQLGEAAEGSDTGGSPSVPMNLPKILRIVRELRSAK